jgi:hypothetical protein
VEEDLCSAHEPGTLQLSAQTVTALAGERIGLALSGLEALMLLSMVQLALRHPEREGGPGLWDFADGFAHGLAERLAAVGPQLAAICEAGFDPAFDVPANSKIILPP